MSAPTPTVEELLLLCNAVAAGLISKYGNRCSVVLMIGMPLDDTAHDRFAAVAAGPCLTTRGLLAWGMDECTHQIDANDTSKSGRPHP